jgi:hypothetical protein
LAKGLAANRAPAHQKGSDRASFGGNKHDDVSTFIALSLSMIISHLKSLSNNLLLFLVSGMLGATLKFSVPAFNPPVIGSNR